jgi:hypothetical protein
MTRVRGNSCCMNVRSYHIYQDIGTTVVQWRVCRPTVPGACRCVFVRLGLSELDSSPVACALRPIDHLTSTGGEGADMSEQSGPRQSPPQFLFFVVHGKLPSAWSLGSAAVAASLWPSDGPGRAMYILSIVQEMHLRPPQGRAVS